MQKLIQSSYYPNTNIPLIIAKHAKARRISIKIDHAKHEIRLILPKRASLRRGKAFLEDNRAWIENKLLTMQEKVPFTPEMPLKLLNEPYIIHYTGKIREKTRIEGAQLIVGGLEEHINRRITTFLKDYCKAYITTTANDYAQLICKTYSRITIKDTTSRWGSCSSTGNLSFNWRLIMAPKEVLDYVIAHEVAHLEEMSHSQAFWTIVESIYPNYAHAKTWLKRHGNSLYTFGQG